MKYTPLPLLGAYLIELDCIEDERGFFARSFCAREFEKQGLDPQLVQCNISFNKTKGTLRGMHYQSGDKGEAKLVRCTKGSIYDVIIDLRAESPTFKQWIGTELSSENRKMYYIPQGFAHGFQTLQHDSEVFYQMSAYFAPEYAQGIRWNDPQFGIIWPQPTPTLISEKDQQYADFH